MKKPSPARKKRRISQRQCPHLKKDRYYSEYFAGWIVLSKPIHYCKRCGKDFSLE